MFGARPEAGSHRTAHVLIQCLFIRVAHVAPRLWRQTNFFMQNYRGVNETLYKHPSSSLDWVRSRERWKNSPHHRRIVSALERTRRTVPPRLHIHTFPLPLMRSVNEYFHHIAVIFSQFTLAIPSQYTLFSSAPDVSRLVPCRLLREGQQLGADVAAASADRGRVPPQLEQGPGELRR